MGIRGAVAEHQRTHESFIDWTVPTRSARTSGQTDDHEGMVLAWKEGEQERHEQHRAHDVAQHRRGPGGLLRPATPA